MDTNTIDTLVKLGTSNPELRQHIRPILKLAAPNPPDDVMEFVKAIERLFSKYMPTGYSSFGISTLGAPSLFFVFASTKREGWPGGIIHNDPMHHILWIHDSFTYENGLNGVLTIELSIGGVVYGPNHSNKARIGWAKKTGDRNTILRHLDGYFYKMRSAYDRMYQSVG